VRTGDLFTLSYVHSSERVPVRGTFRVDADGTLSVTETAFAGFGPGLPELHAGDRWRIADGMIVHEGGVKQLPDYTVHVIPMTRHRLRLPSGADLDLSMLLGSGGRVRVSVR
jgi:hypothetical protein